MEFCKMFRICWISHNTQLDKLFNAWLDRFTPIKLGRECALLSASCSFMSYKENPWWHINIYIMMFPSQFVVNEVWYHSLLNQRFAFIPNDAISTVSCQKKPYPPCLRMADRALLFRRIPSIYTSRTMHTFLHQICRNQFTANNAP